jgi:sulfur relay (sulfurtransferase) DsrC/TusE family protein
MVLKNNKVIFCADGVLRVLVLDYNGSDLIPLKFLQENVFKIENDFEFMIKVSGCPVIFEDGLTVGNFLKCLDPWGKYFSEVTEKDVVAFIDESKKPYVVNDFAKKYWVKITGSMSLSHTLNFSAGLCSTNVGLGNKWNIGGFIEARFSEYSISDFAGDHSFFDLPVNQWSLCKIFMDPNFELSLHNKKTFLNYLTLDKNDYNDLSDVEEIVSEFLAFTGSPVLIEKNMNFIEIVCGFFKNFKETPALRDKLVEWNDSVREGLIDSFKKEDKELENNNNESKVLTLPKKVPNDFKVNNLNKSNKSNVVYKNFSYRPVNNVGFFKDFTFFSGVIDEYIKKNMARESFWSNAKSFYKENNKDYVVKIGRVEEAVLPEYK